jgi:hypothetical protein
MLRLYAEYRVLDLMKIDHVLTPVHIAGYAGSKSADGLGFPPESGSPGSPSREAESDLAAVVS